MANYKQWLVCCCTFLGLFGVVALVCFCIFSNRGCPHGTFKHAAVSADSLKCSKIGRDMLQQGGSAVDGAIAALLCTAIVNPQSMGIGGGSILTLREKTGKVKVFNFRETVPKYFKTNLLDECPPNGQMTEGAQWIGVPGELRGYEAIHRQYGKLKWAKLFEPTIKLAEEGIDLPPYLAKILKHPIGKTRVENSSLCEVLCYKNGTVLAEGARLEFTKLAESLKIIAAQGADAFYNGTVGQNLIKDIKAAGGRLEMEDLNSFKVQVSDAWTVPLGETKMHFAPPPAGGPLLAFILKLLEGYSLSPNSFKGLKQKIQTYHHFVEASKFANGQKKNIRDPNFNDMKNATLLMNLTFINHIRDMISSNSTHDNSYYFNTKPPFDRVGTTHVAVLDEDGLAVSATSTINNLFGGSVYSSSTGIILNDELSDFCRRADSLTPGEQPPSSMTPVILESKSGGLLVIGGSGGSMITAGVALSIMNRLWLGMNLTEAITAPIVFVDSENNLKFEKKNGNTDDFDQTVKEGLISRGHKEGKPRFFLNVVNAVEKENGCIAAVSDSRKMGEAAGY